MGPHRQGVARLGAAARAAATGSDEELMTVLMEECEANPDMDMATMFQDEDEAK